MTLEEFRENFELLVKHHMSDIEQRDSLYASLKRHANTDSFSVVYSALKRIFNDKSSSPTLKSAKIESLAFNTALYRLALHEIESLKYDLSERND